jgi:membrane associated rhomboid family serine protease
LFHAHVPYIITVEFFYRPFEKPHPRLCLISTPCLRQCVSNAGVGANFISATFENACTLLVGASGAVFGLMGLFAADLIVNFESISWPFARVLCIVLFIVFFIVNAVTDQTTPNVSHQSHIGGAICGLFPSLLFLPNLRNKRVKALQQQVEDGEGPAAGATTKCVFMK